MVVLSPADPSLTSSSAAAALETMKSVWRVENIFETLYPQKSQRRAQHTSERADQKMALVADYLHTHPHASWEHLAGVCLYENEQSALQEIKKMVQPSEGMEICK